MMLRNMTDAEVEAACQRAFDEVYPERRRIVVRDAGDRPMKNKATGDSKREQAYAEYCRRVTDAWRHADDVRRDDRAREERGDQRPAVLDASLHQPGYRFSTDQDAQDARAGCDAWAEMVEQSRGPMAGCLIVLTTIAEQALFPFKAPMKMPCRH
jgi:hypothetical protein